MVRWLYLAPTCYESILGFFRSKAWSLDHVIRTWCLFAKNNYPIPLFNHRKLLIGDGIKISKEARKTPGVKYLHQDSNNSGKAEYIRGHHFGYVCLLVGSLRKAFGLPLRGELHEGVDELSNNYGMNDLTIVTRMAYLVISVAKNMDGLCYVALDAYFSTGPAFITFQSTKNKMGEQIVHLITRAKKNYVAYVEHDYNGKNYNNRYKIKLTDLFNYPEWFETTSIMVYGELKTIQYFTIDLLWAPIEGSVRFVLIIDGNSTYILMSSDDQLSGENIITIYSYRMKIEVMFLFLKQMIGGFCYHFWTKTLGKTTSKEQIDYAHLDDDEKEKCKQVLEAIERFVNLAGIALGILQYLSLTYHNTIWTSYCGWLRTYSSHIPSENVVQSVIQNEFFSTLSKVPSCLTLRLIYERSKLWKIPLKT
jgi:hypothetical protein